MYAMENIKIRCQSCDNERFFKKYQPIKNLECPDCGSKVNIYSLDYGLKVVMQSKKKIY